MQYDTTYANRRAIAALVVAVALGTGCRDAPVSPQPRITTSLSAHSIKAITDDVELLRALVSQLEADATLNKGQANALTSKIDAAARQLQRGNEHAGENVFDAFIHQVNAFVNARVLTVTQAQPLLDAALSSTGKRRRQTAPRRRLPLHLRADDDRRGAMLGLESIRPAWRRDHRDPSCPSRGQGRPVVPPDRERSFSCLRADR